ncbi:adenosine deaminase [Nocardia sp. alder85J]|uniref:adenosine deaminase n=1 Tax=Nocardia sp. alder85J TaxID=2862949 RepID=UPI001CD5512F|nr:adenosine deaminase [Nocardia sp. alder85J]MCX4096993.1 adenosine deaminase [Nocardia sp. alder85J]
MPDTTETPVLAETFAFAAAMPKVSLHCHLTGTLQPATVAALAAKHGVRMPDGRTPETLYDHGSYEDLPEFLRVLDLVGAVMLDHNDFHRATYETLTLAAEHNVIYREMFISPPSHPTVPYKTMIDGITAALRDAEADHGIICRLIFAINRNDTPARGVDLVREVIAHRTDDILGIGLDYEEITGPPQRFVEAFALAEQAGLHRTAHSESGPPANILTLLDLLHCERIDHGYHVVRDPAITRRCRDENIPFTCTPVSSDIGRYSGSGDGTHEVIAAMVDAGLAVTIDGDDPPMFGTDPTTDLTALVRALGYGPDQLMRFTEAGIEAAWLDESDKAALRARVSEAKA